MFCARLDVLYYRVVLSQGSLTFIKLALEPPRCKFVSHLFPAENEHINKHVRELDPADKLICQVSEKMNTSIGMS